VKKLLVSGMLAATPHHGGATWATLQYVLGLRRLGHDVFFIEPVAAASLVPTGASLLASDNAAYFLATVRRFGLDGSAALLLAGTRETVGATFGDLQRAAARCDALINLSGVLARPEITSSIPIRAYVDLDPAFNQLWHAVEGIDVGMADHTHFITVGLGLGEPDCPVPTCGVTWIRTLPPVVLDRWPAVDPPDAGPITTVGNWRSYGSIEVDGVLFGQKAHSTRQLMDIPTRSRERFLLALSIHAHERRDLDALARHGWTTIDPTKVAASPDAYQRFIQRSYAELGIAKSGYVLSRCGWFSDRSACYLATSRPVVAQETGFSRHVPTGEGLLSFASVDEAISALEAVRADYRRHAIRARALAEELFGSDLVLSRILREIGAAS